MFLHPQRKHHSLTVRPNLEGCASSFSKPSEMAICYPQACGWVSSLHFSRPGLIRAPHCSVNGVRTPRQSCPGFPGSVLLCGTVSVCLSKAYHFHVHISYLSGLHPPAPLLLLQSTPSGQSERPLVFFALEAASPI